MIERASVGEPARATLLLTRRCNNGCVFCARPSEAELREPDGLAERLASLREAADEVSFVGGEPTLVPELTDLVRQARSLGFRAVGLQTNARMLARPGFADGLREAGLTDVHVSVHGSEPGVHDYHTGVPGSLAQTMAGLGAARAARLEVVVTTVLTRSNYRSLAALPSLLASRGVAAFHVAVPVARGRAAEAFDRVVPRLALALPFALHALSAAAKLGLPTYVSGAPLCLLGPFAERSISLPADAVRAFAPACDACGLRPRCPGVDASYLARFAGDELAARETAAPPERADRLARMFTGPAELAEPSTRVMPEHPRESRRRLPVLSRPQPGAQEVRRAEPKTGEALREIFPTLFADDGEG